MGWRGGAAEQTRSAQGDNPIELTPIELDFAELLAKGFDPMDASRSLGLSFATGAQLRRVLELKLNAADENHLKVLVSSIVRSRPFERFAVLDC